MDDDNIMIIMIMMKEWKNEWLEMMDGNVDGKCKAKNARRDT